MNDAKALFDLSVAVALKSNPEAALIIAGVGAIGGIILQQIQQAKLNQAELHILQNSLNTLWLQVEDAHKAFVNE